MSLSNKTYDVLKWIALVVLPAIGALYFGIAQIWGLPYAEQVVGTITAIDTFLGALLGITSLKYNDGTMHVDTSREEKNIYQFEFDPDDAITKQKIVLKVDPKATLTSASTESK